MAETNAPSSWPTEVWEMGHAQKIWECFFSCRFLSHKSSLQIHTVDHVMLSYCCDLGWLYCVPIRCSDVIHEGLEEEGSKADGSFYQRGVLRPEMSGQCLVAVLVGCRQRGPWSTSMSRSLLWFALSESNGTSRFSAWHRGVL